MHHDTYFNSLFFSFFSSSFCFLLQLFLPLRLSFFFLNRNPVFPRIIKKLTFLDYLFTVHLL